MMQSKKESGNGNQLGDELAPISVNWHVWKYCNYRCKFCFAVFEEIKGHLPRKLALKVPPLLAEAGTRKLSFAGGEPTLCPWLRDLLQVSKNFGMTTMLITNASRMTRSSLEFIASHLDWICVSIDSPSDETERRLGRGNGRHVKRAIKVLLMAKELGIKIKINTVITALNYQDDFSWIIETVRPNRWKVFQVLPIKGQNDKSIQSLLVTEEQFLQFCRRHDAYHPVIEKNDDMLGSYLMLDPLGRFFDNSRGFYEYSQSILEVGVKEALGQVTWDAAKFRARGGEYDW